MSTSVRSRKYYTSDESGNSAQAFTILSHYSKAIKELYTTCLVVSGSHQAARECLCDCLIAHPRQTDVRKMRKLCAEIALKHIGSSVEIDYLNDAPGLGDLSYEMRRCAMLLYGCGLSVSQAARALGLSKAAVREMDLKARASLKCPKDTSRRRMLAILCRKELKNGAEVPEEAYLVRTMAHKLEQQSASSRVQSSSSGSPSLVFSFLFLLVLCAGIWLSAVIFHYFLQMRH